MQTYRLKFSDEATADAVYDTTCGWVIHRMTRVSIATKDRLPNEFRLAEQGYVSFVAAGRDAADERLRQKGRPARLFRRVWAAYRAALADRTDQRGFYEELVAYDSDVRWAEFAEAMTAATTPLNVRIARTPTDVAFAYDEENYSRSYPRGIGDLADSCMRHSRIADRIGAFYGCDADRVGVAYAVDGDGAVIARAVVWYGDQGGAYYDRIYANDHTRLGMERWFAENGYESAAHGTFRVTLPIELSLDSLLSDRDANRPYFDTVAVLRHAAPGMVGVGYYPECRGCGTDVPYPRWDADGYPWCRACAEGRSCEVCRDVSNEPLPAHGMCHRCAERYACAAPGCTSRVYSGDYCEWHYAQVCRGCGAFHAETDTESRICPACRPRFTCGNCGGTNRHAVHLAHGLCYECSSRRCESCRSIMASGVWAVWTRRDYIRMCAGCVADSGLEPWGLVYRQ